MSFHMVDCAAQVTLPDPNDPGRRVPLEPSWKLVLMRFADSADTITGIGFPGMAGVLAWSGLSRSRAYEVINELEQLGLLRKHRAGGNGRRAEYVVFPHGCCEQHQRPPADVEDPESAGSDPSDPDHGAGSGPSDPADRGDQGPTHRTHRVRPTGPAGSDQGPTHRTPSSSSTTSTTGGTGTTDGRGVAPHGDDDEHGPRSPFCGQHPDGTPVACVACRRRREGFERAEPKRAAARRRAESDAAIQADRSRKGATEHVDAAAHAREARDLLASARTGGAE